MLIDLDLHLHHETEKAILVSDDGERENAVWIPKSLCEFETAVGDIVKVTLSERTATEKGLV